MAGAAVSPGGAGGARKMPVRASGIPAVGSGLIELILRDELGSREVEGRGLVEVGFGLGRAPSGVNRGGRCGRSRSRSFVRSPRAWERTPQEQAQVHQRGMDCGRTTERRRQAFNCASEVHWESQCTGDARCGVSGIRGRSRAGKWIGGSGPLSPLSPVVTDTPPGLLHLPVGCLAEAGLTSGDPEPCDSVGKIPLKAGSGLAWSPPISLLFPSTERCRRASGRAIVEVRIRRRLARTSEQISSTWKHHRREVAIGALMLLLLALVPVAIVPRYVHFDPDNLPDIEPFIRFELPTTGVV